MKKPYIGVIDDPRSEEEKAFDFSFDGIAMGDIVPEWKEKTNFKSYKIKNQDGSLSCVAQATSKLLGIHEVVEGKSYQDLSPKFIYTRRTNYPDGGMYFQNALEIACKVGTCKETQLPSDMRGEAYMNDKSQETDICSITALDYRGKSYVKLYNNYLSNGLVDVDIDKIAGALSQGYGVLLGFTFDYDEWTTTPTIHPDSKNECRHGVAGTDFGLMGGKKYISIDDSWGPGTGRGGQRFISEDFLKAKCIYAGYALSLVKEVDVLHDFHYYWNNIMVFNSPHNNKQDVAALQEALQSIGKFPVNAKIDGIYGPITRKAVYDFQKAYVGVDNKGIQVGPKTLAALNEKFK